jgi:hypothetical protein
MASYTRSQATVIAQRAANPATASTR